MFHTGVCTTMSPLKPERAQEGQRAGLTWVGLADAVLIWRPAGAFHWCTRAPVPASTTRTSRGVTCSSPSSSVLAQHSVCADICTL